MQEKNMTKIKDKKKKRKLEFKKYGFIILIALFSIQLVISTLYLINSNTEYRIFNHAYVEAVLPGQDLGGILNTGVVKVTEFNSEETNVGDYVVIYGDFGLEEYWVELVSENDTDSNTIISSYDSVIATESYKEDVEGTFVENASFLGLLAYFSSFLIGYFLLFTLEALIVFAYYYFIIRGEKELVDLIENENDE